MGQAQQARIEALEAELRQRDREIIDLKADLGDTHAMYAWMRDHIADMHAMTDDWLAMDDHDAGLRGEHADLLEQHRQLVAEANRLRRAVGSSRPTGRPLAASAKQQADVVKRRKAGESLRAIAAATGLSVRSVRTVVAKAAGTDAASRKAKEARKVEFTRQRVAAFRARKKARDALPKRVEELRKTGAKLLKQAKGLG
jgi:hypothetical protein